MYIRFCKCLTVYGALESHLIGLKHTKCALFLGNAHFFVLIYRHLKQSNGFCQNNEINAIN